MSKYRSEELQRLANAVVHELRRLEYIKVEGDERGMAAKIVAVIQETFDKEAELEREAERLAAVHGAKMTGLDHRKVIQGIKARLAEERKFPL